MASEPTIPKLHRYDANRRRWLSTWYDERGNRHSKSFGFEDEVTKQQAIRKWEAWKLKWKSRRFITAPPKDDPAAFTVTRLAARYLRHAGRTFRKDGLRTSHVWNVKYAMRALRDAYGKELADAIGSPKIAALRDGPLIWRSLDDAEKKARGIKTVNTRLRIVKDAFAWAREMDLISRETLADVLSIRRLRKGRSEATPSKKVKSISADVVTATMQHAPQVIKDMVELQELAGMRPGEVCSMRGVEIEAGGDVWLYRPRHKMEHAEGDAAEKIVCFGPKAIAIIKRYLRPDLSAYLFSPATAHGQRLEARRAARKTKLYPSHAAKRRENPTGRLGTFYTEAAYRKAIHYACKLAGIRKWAPNQLRHSAATRIEKKYGRAGSRVVLGHKHEATTDIYLGPDVQRAMQIAREVG